MSLPRARDISLGERTETIGRTSKANKAPEASTEQQRYRPRVGHLPVDFFGYKNAPLQSEGARGSSGQSPTQTSFLRTEN